MDKLPGKSVRAEGFTPRIFGRVAVEIFAWIVLGLAVVVLIVIATHRVEWVPMLLILAGGAACVRVHSVVRRRGVGDGAALATGLASGLAVGFGIYLAGVALLYAMFIQAFGGA